MKWILALQNSIKDSNRAKLLNYFNSSKQKSQLTQSDSITESDIEPKFELGDMFIKEKSTKILKPQQVYKYLIYKSIN